MEFFRGRRLRLLFILLPKATALTQGRNYGARRDDRTYYSVVQDKLVNHYAIVS